MYEIEKGIPICVNDRENSLASIMRKMVHGDSVVIPKSCRPNAFATATRLGKKAVTRAVESDKIRVWIVDR